MDFSYGGMLVVVIIAFAAPLLARAVPRLRVPAVALEIILGIVVGPSVLGWVEMDAPLTVLGSIGLAFLLFIGGLEIDLGSLRGRTVRITRSWGLTCLIAGAAGGALALLDHGDHAVILAIALSSTSLGLVVPILRDIGANRGSFGQTVLASSSVAEFGALLLLSILFSTTGDSPAAQVVLLGVFTLALGAIAASLFGVGRRTRLLAVIDELADTASQLRVRALMVVLFVFVVLASGLGFEAILGSFAAGVLLRFLDREDRLDNPRLALKLDGIGYGFLVPIFFVTSGIKVDASALIDSPRHLVLIPLLVLGMLLARGIASLSLFSTFSPGRARAAALLAATNLSFMVIAADVGSQLDVVDAATAAAMVLAGVASVLVFPPAAVALLPAAATLDADWDEQDDVIGPTA